MITWPVWAGAGLVVLLLVAAGLRVIAHRLLLRGLHPARLPHEKQPAELGIPSRSVQSVTLRGPGGADLFAWFITPTTAPVGPVSAVLIMHGWGSNASLMLPAVPVLLDAGLAVLVMDARCHGLSDGADFTSMPRFAEDIEVGLNWLADHPDIEPASLALMGHSVGAAAALLCAARRTDVRAVVSLGAFAHPADVMTSWLGTWRIPQRVLGDWVLAHVQKVIGARFDDIAPISSVRRVNCPILLVHGVNDDTVPFADALRILAASGRSDDALMAVAGGHDLSEALSPSQSQRIGRFIKDASAGIQA
jgi:dipeptidyl aminopeptidase/acylaminoacyl peptidase